MCKITTSPTDEPTGHCDGCDAECPVEDLTASTVTYSDEEQEVYHFCPACVQRDMEAYWGPDLYGP